MPIEQARHHRTGSPVTVRPMTRRWISDVPSKMVKIFGSLRTALLSPVYAGKWADSSAWLGLERPPAPSSGPPLLPELLPGEHAPETCQLTIRQRAGEACCICSKAFPRVLYGQLPDGTPLLMCDDHDLPAVSTR